MNDIIETDRLVLRDLTEDEIIKFNARNIGKYDNNEFSIYLKDNNEKIGMLGFKYLDDNKVELRYGIASKYRSNGYMTEILKSFVNYLFNRGFDSIIVIVEVDNNPSNRVVNKLNFELIKKVDIEGHGLCNYYELKREV